MDQKWSKMTLKTGTAIWNIFAHYSFLCLKVEVDKQFENKFEQTTAVYLL